MRLVDRIDAWVLIELSKLQSAIRAGWKRMLAGAFVGWVTAVVLGAVALATLEAKGVISREVSDDLAIVAVLFGIGFGALNGHALRPTEARTRARRQRRASASS